MSAPGDRGPGAEDRALLQRMASEYAPPPLSAGERAAFDARLSARLERAERLRWISAAGALGAAAAVGAALLVALTPREPLPRDPAPGVAALLEAALDDEAELVSDDFPGSYALLDQLMDETAEDVEPAEAGEGREL